MNDLPKFRWLRDIPFWILFVFVLIGAICEILFRRFDLLTSLIPIATGMVAYLVFRRPGRIHN